MMVCIFMVSRLALLSHRHIFTEPWYIFNFFLTYRLFMTPRTVLLSFQKRLRDLDDFPSDPIFAGFVQQK